MKDAPTAERGAALLAVLAMVVLLASFAAIGLSRLKAATDGVTDAEARSEAMLLADSGVAAARFMVSRVKAEAQATPGLPMKPVEIPFAGGEVTLRFHGAANCFNLNSLARPPAKPGEPPQPAQTKVDDFTAMLTAAGVPMMEAGPLAEATAARLAQTGVLWSDGSEWAGVKGVTMAHWKAVGRMLCALPNRETTAININELTIDDAPLLAAMGIPADQARRALAARPRDGWTSANSFWEQAAPAGIPDNAGAQSMGVSSRWMRVELEAETPRARLHREILLDSARMPARVAASRWGAVEVPPIPRDKDERESKA